MTAGLILNWFLVQQNYKIVGQADLSPGEAWPWYQYWSHLRKGNFYHDAILKLYLQIVHMLCYTLRINLLTLIINYLLFNIYTVYNYSSCILASNHMKNKAYLWIPLLCSFTWVWMVEVQGDTVFFYLIWMIRYIIPQINHLPDAILYLNLYPRLDNTNDPGNFFIDHKHTGDTDDVGCSRCHQS